MGGLEYNRVKFIASTGAAEVKRESGENPERSRHCKSGSKPAYMPLNFSGKARVNNDP
jgi:hypothetical protein